MLSTLGKFKGCGFAAKLSKTTDDEDVNEGRNKMDLKLKTDVECDREGMERAPQGYINDVFVKDRISTISSDSFQSLSEYK